MLIVEMCIVYVVVYIVFTGVRNQRAKLESMKLKSEIVRINDSRVNHSQHMEPQEERFGQQIFARLQGTIEERFPCDYKGRAIKVERELTSCEDVLHVFILDEMSSRAGSPGSPGHPIATLVKHSCVDRRIEIAISTPKKERFTFPKNVFGAMKAIDYVLELVEESSLRL